jgi:hypothetical protein
VSQLIAVMALPLLVVGRESVQAQMEKAAIAMAHTQVVLDANKLDGHIYQSILKRISGRGKLRGGKMS